MTYNLIRTWCMLGGILLLNVCAEARNNNFIDKRDSLKRKLPLPIEEKQTRSFPQLESYMQNLQTAFSIPLEPSEAMPEFSNDFISRHFTTTEAMADARAQAQATMDEIERKGSYSTYLSPNDLVELPVGLKKKLGNTNVTVGVSKAKFFPEYSLLTVFCKIDLPQGKSIFFGADSIKLSHKGGLVGKGDLVLLGDFAIPINGGNMMLTLKGGLDMKTGNVNQLTYVKLECNGVKEIGITADVSFPRSLLVPLTSDYKVEPDANKKVQGSFSTKVTDWNDILADISLPPFALKGMERVAFKLDKAIFDLSDKRNDPSVVFPADYGNLIATQRELWRGVYIKEFDVILPKEFKDKSKQGPVTFKAEKLLIDNTGLTGLISANNILNTGTASGWDFSIEKFEIQLQSNTLRRAGFNGSIAIPVSKKKNPTDSVKQYGLAYRAVFLSSSDYLMNVSLKDSVSFDVWKAKAKIFSGSYVELINKDEQFRPKAVLTGELSININGAADNKSEFSMGKVGFQNLTLQTIEPYIKIEGGGFTLQKAPNSMANFPITIDAVRLNIVGKEVMLSLDTIRLNLMDNGGISAKGSVSIVGEVDKVGDDIVFEYKRLLVNDIGIAASFGGFKFDGTINIFREHPIMGTGFAGQANMSVKLGGGDTIAISAKAAFGRKTYRYWYVDVLASGFEIPVGASFKINGLGGGASYQMQRQASIQGSNISAVCPSGIGYVPDSTVGLGFRAMASFIAGSDKVAQGDVTLEMLFNSTARGGGLAQMGLYGKATIIPPPALLNIYNGSSSHLARLAGNLKTQALSIDTAAHNAALKSGDFGKLAVMSKDTLKEESAGSIFASVGLKYDFNNKVLDGNFLVMMNIAGGLIRGNRNDTAGYAKIHFAPNRWYIHMGTSEPGQELGVTFDIGVGLIQSKAYLMVGDSIGSSPPPPVEVATILGRSVQDLDYMRDLNALKKGGGFAFGARLETRFDSQFGKLFTFYSRFSAGVGFDIMLKRYLDSYGNPAHCKDQTSPLGVNGWYANGQAYAYLQGVLGIKVKLSFVEKDIDIITAAAAVLLQAKAPNPTWMQGYLGGKFSVLGGAINGSFSCKVTLGQNCEIEGVSPVDEKVEFITQIIPENKADGVDPLGIVQAFFKYPLDKPFYLTNGESGEQIEYNKNDLSVNAANNATNIENSALRLKARLITFQLVNKTGGNIVTNPFIFSSDKTSVEYANADALPGTDSITATVEVAFDTYDNGSWSPFIIDEKAVTQKKTITFKTAAQPQTIPFSNIEYSYPIIDQSYFYPKEHNQGFIKLKRNQLYLFGANSFFKIQFVRPNANNIEVPAVYNNMTQEFTYTMPALDTNKNYTLNVLMSPIPKKIKTKILTYNFKSSHHNTFAEKLTTYVPRSFENLKELKFVNGGNNGYGGAVIGFTITADIQEIEPFDVTEVLGTLATNRKPLINPEATMNDAYYLNDVQPFMSAGYNLLRLTRDVNILGLPPKKAILPRLYKSNGDINRFPYVHAVSSIFAEDLQDFKLQLFKEYPTICTSYVKCPVPNNSSAQFTCNFCCAECLPQFNEYWKQELYTKSLPLMRDDKYDVNFKYILPNGTQTSQPVFSYYHTNTTISAEAGGDQIKTNGTFTLSAIGTGKWSIAQAPSGFSESNISSLTSSSAIVTGVPLNSDVILRWTIKDPSGADLADLVTLTHVSGALAGDDQTAVQDTFVLNGNARGRWSIISEDACLINVKISDPFNPRATVTDLPLEKPVTLRWLLQDDTGTLFDDIVLTRQVPANMAGQDILSPDSVFTISSLLRGGIWKVSGNISYAIDDTTSQQTTITISEPNKPIRLTWTVKDMCNQIFTDETLVMWTKADLGPNQCLGNGTFSTKGVGVGTWSIVNATAGLNVAVDSFVTAGEAYTSLFNMPVLRLPLNGSITLRWKLPNGDQSDVQFKRIEPVSAGIDQSQFDSVFTLNASVGNGTWSIASAPSNFAIGNIEDIYSPTTKVILPANATVTLVWSIDDECWKGMDTVILKHKSSLANAGVDLLTSKNYSILNAVGIGTWSIVKKPIDTYVYFDNANSPKSGVTIFTQTDSVVTLRWTLTDGDYDEMSITKKEQPSINIKVFIDTLYNPNTGLMMKPSNIMSSIPPYLTNPTILNRIMNDSSIVGFIFIGYRLFPGVGEGGKIVPYLLRNDGYVVDLDDDTNLYPGYFPDFTTMLTEPDETKLFYRYHLLLNYYIPNSVTNSYRYYDDYTQNPINLTWGKLTTIDFTNNNPLIYLSNKTLTQINLTSGQSVYVLKIRR